MATSHRFLTPTYCRGPQSSGQSSTTNCGALRPLSQATFVGTDHKPFVMDKSLGFNYTRLNLSRACPGHAMRIKFPTKLVVVGGQLLEGSEATIFTDQVHLICQQRFFGHSPVTLAILIAGMEVVGRRHSAATLRRCCLVDLSGKHKQLFLLVPVSSPNHLPCRGVRLSL